MRSTRSPSCRRTEEDPTIDAEPGKIVHEVREGRCAEFWFPRYYGSIDSTPLYLVLLAETWRWTDDASFAQRMREPALLALEWIDRYGDRDGDGFVEYSRMVDSGLANQSWKDSGDSQRFQDGSFAEAPIAAVEVQGYVYDAKRGLAEIAREVWRDKELADRLEREADELRTRFDEAFWVEERGGFYALALDGQKRRVDSRSSNMGHLLWSGIVPPERVSKVVDQLLSEELWSGWGIRTMASDAAAFNPISYHNGTVWPHDTSLAAWGLARHGYTAEARRIGRALIEAAAHFDWSLPEVFAGYARDETPFPIAYPTAARPQAWAAGTPILLVRVLLGIEPDRERQRLVSTVTDELPSWLDGLRIEGVRAYGRTWTVAVERGRVTIAEGVDDENRPCLSGVVPGSAGGVRRDRARRRAPRRRPRRRRVTTSRSSRRATRRRARGSSRSSTPRRASGSGTRTGRCSTRVHAFLKADEFDVLHDHTGMLGLAFGGLIRHAVLSHRARAARRPAGPHVRAGARARAEGEAHLHLDEPAQAEAAPSRGSRTARTRSTSRCTRSGASPEATTSCSSVA